MAIILGVQESYCTVPEADTFLDLNAAWQGTNDDLKVTALLAARYFVDITFSCDLSDYTEIPEALKLATATLAADYALDQTVFDDDVKLKEKEIKADGISSRKVYSSTSNNKPKSLTIVRSMLKDLCSQGGLTVNLGRA